MTIEIAVNPNGLYHDLAPITPSCLVGYRESLSMPYQTQDVLYPFSHDSIQKMRYTVILASLIHCDFMSAFGDHYFL
jgi:hypothetical protein